MAERVLYGEVNEQLVFIRGSLLDSLYATRNAIDSAKTWGEFFALLPPDERKLVKEMIEDSDVKHGKNDPFDVDDIGAYGDGDWPAWPAQDMLSWVPESVAALGSVSSSVLNGSFMEFSLADESAIIEAFRREGYDPVRNDAAVLGASG